MLNFDEIFSLFAKKQTILNEWSVLHKKIGTSLACSNLVPLTGLEPVRDRSHGILSPGCLPIPPQRRVFN